MRVGVALLCRAQVPLNGGEVIHRHTLALVVHQRQVELGSRVTLLGGQGVVLDGLEVIQLDALTHVVHVGYGELGLGITLGCSFAVEFEGLGIILLDAFTIVVTLRQFPLGLGITVERLIDPLGDLRAQVAFLVVLGYRLQRRRQQGTGQTQRKQ